jgi:hypothetical protein
MPAAIVGFRSPHGFVTAADGRSGKVLDDGSYKPLNYKVQKVFCLEGDGSHLTWAVSGNAEIRASDDREVAVDINAEIGNSARLFLRAGSISDINTFVDAIGRRVNDAMETARSAGKFSSYPAEPAGEIFRLFVQGYFKGRPGQAVRRFWHNNQVLQETEDTTDFDARQGRYFAGSKKVFDVLSDGDDRRLSAYKIGTNMDTLSGYVETAKAYIRAHGDAEALMIDNPACRAIGGHIHIATITQDHGVRWVAGFAPINESKY